MRVTTPAIIAPRTNAPVAIPPTAPLLNVRDCVGSADEEVEPCGVPDPVGTVPAGVEDEELGFETGCRVPAAAQSRFAAADCPNKSSFFIGGPVQLLG